MNSQSKVSPPFEGGVAVIFDYHLFTMLNFTAGVVDSTSAFLH
jgi:hypothetical protein